MKWFYSQMDTVWVNSESYRQSWIERGLPAQKMHILPRGLDTELFCARRRDEKFWPAHGAAPGAVVLLYVGRISKEKNLDVLVDAWRQLHESHGSASPLALALVGDGPYRAELSKMIPEAIFTGYLSGEQLATAFASADVFVFPSTTDTFGNVVIEAQACGLPCIVTDVGGPKDLVHAGVTGAITRGHDARDLARAIAQIAGDAGGRTRMREACVQAVAGRDWKESARRWWDTTN
jgi:glycosyltransferase involved in cell wall biosynthesis